jgi:ferredoxin
MEDHMAGTVTIDEDECIGCETCCELVPGVFQFDADSGKAKVVNPTGAADDEIQGAIDACPATCISWK